MERAWLEWNAEKLVHFCCPGFEPFWRCCSSKCLWSWTIQRVLSQCSIFTQVHFLHLQTCVWHDNMVNELHSFSYVSIFSIYRTLSLPLRLSIGDLTCLIGDLTSGCWFMCVTIWVGNSRIALGCALFILHVLFHEWPKLLMSVVLTYIAVYILLDTHPGPLLAWVWHHSMGTQVIFCLHDFLVLSVRSLGNCTVV